MLWRHLCRVRAWSAAGLLICSLCAAPAPASADVDDPPPPAAVVSETVPILKAQRAGDLTVEARGQGQTQVRITLRNTSAKRLNVVLPPGLVASGAVGQGARGGFQSMGLGSAAARPGGFGAFQTAANTEGGLRSIPAVEDRAADAVAVPPGKSVELSVPSVCLNYGVATPTARDKFELVDVADYTSDPRARKALRTISTYGTSQGVAQAVAWRVFNDVPFAAMLAQNSKAINVHEAGLAARFVEALNASNDEALVDPAYLTTSRMFVQVQGEGPLAADARRLQEQMDGLRVLGLPVRVVEGTATPEVQAPALFLRVTLAESKPGETKARLLVNHAAVGGVWAPLGKTAFVEPSTASVLDGPGLARALDRALASSFVSAKVVKKGPNSTTVKVENRLPFSLTTVILKATGSAGAPAVPFAGLGIGPVRSMNLSIQAPGGTVERVEANGL